MRRILLATCLAAAAVFAAVPAHACGCGIALEASVSRERALVVDRPGREEIVLSLDLRSDGAGRSAVVLPVPGDPEVVAIEDGDPLQYLDIATLPRARAGGGDEGAVGAGAPGVDVIGRDVIGGYDVTRLRSDDSGALDDWLDANGYTLPDGAEPILADYVDDDWRFVAIQLAQGSAGTLKPLDVAFDTDSPVYPSKLSRLATEPFDLTVYTLADGPRKIDGLTGFYGGAVADLDPPPPAELEELFARGSYVTGLRAEHLAGDFFTDDLAILDAGPGDASAGPPSTGAPTWGLVLALACALGGLGLLALSRTR